ncbi:response regulator [Parapedobacter indicus]|uniref:Two-component system, OmpR family, phosphate regulon response regulator PhoB/two-component system, OmpR family, alkaline phosphatase synthesis response regulator PhoP n=1 Tax=Parapedobacter indicus TaxID=1477437 RepID=A0A1I3HLV6_9SPHI|nr:response regulator [Parapedobacter indicus]PPL03087.1 response regulator receiver domain-containing protein [Parapedobacter indicus]SFI36567.1 two-component system, OmpR family, phosphate regulon response regulator PhoB/two-component system, OmpR family, alkaline phosphatase synthesis response regulator PhoP [Parapedobacter indicus]
MKTLFFVEDDESLQDIAQLVFREPKFTVRVFNSAEELLDERDVPHVYVLDKQLPGIDGLELCRILKSNTQTNGIPVVMVSADPNIKVLAASAGADAVLEKPFSIHELETLVANVRTQIS